jgi:hypothetical protein
MDINTCSCGKQCSYTCYDGYINITYDVSNITYHQTKILVYYKYKYQNELNTTLNTYYPINNTLMVWYQLNNPNDYDFNLKDNEGWYVAFYFMVALSILTLVIWAPIEITHMCRKSGMINDIEMNIKPT